VNPRRLYRCRHDRQLAGVASGMAEYLGLDPTIVRILWILSVFFGGFSILVYIVLAFVMPLEPIGTAGPPSSGDAATTTGDPASGETQAWTAPAAAPDHEHRERGEGRIGLAVGVLLVAFGSIALFGPVLPGWIAGIALWPAFVVALGIALVVVAIRRPAAEP
jgi:phage shock protein C